MGQLVGRDAVVRHIVAAVERARTAGGGIVCISGAPGVGTTAVVEEALRIAGDRHGGAVPRAPGGAVATASLRAPSIALIDWHDDAQRMPDADVARLLSDPARIVVLSGRAPWGRALRDVERAAARVDPGSVIDVEPLPPELAVEIVTRSHADAYEWMPRDDLPDQSEADAPVVALARACGGRLRLLAAVVRTSRTGDAAASDDTAVRLAVDDLLADISPSARRLLETVAIGGSGPRVAAVQGAWDHTPDESSDFDVALAELQAAGVVGAPALDRLRPGVPVVCEVLAARLGPARVAALHLAYVQILSGLGGVDPREIAEHVRPVADRLPCGEASAVLIDSAARRTEASDHRGAVADLDVAATLLESAAATDPARHGAAAFDALVALGAEIYHIGDLDGGERVLRRAERFAPEGAPETRAQLELYRTYIRADRGQPSEVPGLARTTASHHPADDAVLRLFLVDRGDDPAELEAVCAALIALGGDNGADVDGVDRGAAALGRSVRASLAGDLDEALAEAEAGLALVGDTSVAVYGGIERELIRLCVLRGDLDAAQRHADGDGFDIAGRVPRIVEASNVVHAASVALLRGDVAQATERAEQALTTTRLAPAPRGLVRCAAWVALLSAMRGDLPRARSLIAEAGRAFPLDGNLRLAAIMHLARVQVALRGGGPMPSPAELRLERTEGPSRLLLPVLRARLGLQCDDRESVEACLAELDRLHGSRPAEALARRIRALQLVPTRRRREAAELLAASAADLDRLGFRVLAAETRLEWAELAAEVAEPWVRADIVDLVHYFDAQGIDDWADRARRLARTLGVRVGGRRGGTDQLTRRESEVVDLVVEGHSNAEIARRLFLSERTVETHLQHVYRRLGVDSRMALVQRQSAIADPEAAR